MDRFDLDVLRIGFTLAFPGGALENRSLIDEVPVNNANTSLQPDTALENFTHVAIYTSALHGLFLLDLCSQDVLPKPMIEHFAYVHGCHRCLSHNLQLTQVQ